MSSRPVTVRALPTVAGLVAGYLADTAFGDPRRGHPVALFGAGAERLERLLWRDSRAWGTAYAGLCVAAGTAIGVAAHAGTGRRPLARASVTALATWVVLGGRGLAEEGQAMAELLDEAAACGDPGPARARLSHLCGRDASELDTVALTRAATESIAENTSDAVVAPLLWGGVAGVPGLLGYRALNTLDAMVGHRSPRYRRFGWAGARGDDLANLVPARFGAFTATVAAPLVAGRVRDAARAWWRDAGKHPSPNAGPVEAAFAGALGVRLGGVNRYGTTVEDRGSLGIGPDPNTTDLRRSVRLSRIVGAAALAGGALLAVGREVVRAGSTRGRRG
ncbi:cobalamin biosynthesis protein [Haloechinothrix sp. LS1_15]|uniref:cobalamin biosynthesis protein n=1 Tax=Haloechinothrix sp. LS1_15 TaxID=2652248 RepID=UPI002948B024|nr:cobalamin biosynthesis protein [Haloechinothrix sp. LS1_15]MDV6013714.1 cobalamin biosynthesis protein [Haloechinothrix sp. LS1_15]